MLLTHSWLIWTFDNLLVALWWPSSCSGSVSPSGFTSCHGQSRSPCAALRYRQKSNVFNPHVVARSASKLQNACRHTHTAARRFYPAFRAQRGLIAGLWMGPDTCCHQHKRSHTGAELLNLLVILPLVCLSLSSHVKNTRIHVRQQPLR